MKHILLLVALMLGASAAAAAPSDPSLRELLEVSHSRQLFDGSMGQMDSVIQTSMLQALQGRQVTPEVQASMDRMRARMVALINEEVGRDKLGPINLDIYQQSLSQSEVDGMIAFYKSVAEVRQQPAR